MIGLGNAEEEWLANEDGNLRVKKNSSSVNVHKQMLEFSFIRHFHLKTTKEQILSHYQQLCLNTPGMLSKFYLKKSLPKYKLNFVYVIKKFNMTL